MTSGQLRLRVTAEPSHLAIARAFISTSLRTLEQPETSINDLRLAVSELLTVLVVDQQSPIEVELSFDNQQLITTISVPAGLPTVPDEIAELVGRLVEGLDVQQERWVIRTTRQ